MERVHRRSSFFIRASRSGREETLLHPSAQRKYGAQHYKLFTVHYSARSRRLLEPLHAAGSRFSFGFLRRQSVEFCGYLQAFHVLLCDHQCFTSKKYGCDCTGSVYSFIGKHNHPTEL